MRLLYHCLFLLTFSVILSDTFAQQKKETITGIFQAVPFPALVKQIENQTSYKFYYASTLDSIVITLNANEQDIHTVLTQAFSQTDINYAIDAQRHVYVVKERALQSTLPVDFYHGENSNTDNSNKALLDYLEQDKQRESTLMAEAKQYDIGKRTRTPGPGNAIVAGYIRSSNNGEPVIGASVYVENPLIGVVTDQFGYYAITLPRGKHDLKFKSLGMKSTQRKVTLYSDGKLDIELVDDVTPLKEVIVESDRDKNISGMQMGLEKLDIKTMKKIPVVFGEVDVIKVMLTLPGVQTVGEGTTGLNVRGGATNQNLILFNDATIYNPSHLFGFFSAFNPDAVKNVELYKSGIPAEFGGRLSSVIDVNSREGNKKKFSASGGIGPVTSRLLFEGPIIKDKISFLVGARSTYSDWLLKKIPNDELKHSRASFYDVNGNINYEINEKNTVYSSGYLSNDQFTLNNNMLYDYSNRAATLKWKHIFNNKLYTVFTSNYSSYDYAIESSKNPKNAFILKYAIRQSTAKLDFNYYPVTKHSFNFGLSAIQYSLKPGTILKKGDVSNVTSFATQKEQGLESAIYLADHYEINPALSLYLGIRYSMFNLLGPRDVYTYPEGQSREVDNIVDTLSYRAGKSIANYSGPEYRASIKYAITTNSSVKLSYNRTRQYIQMLSNTTAIAPTDIWKLSDNYLKPQIGDQISLGLYKNFRASTIETSVEGYYKTMANAIDYKGGSTLVSVDNNGDVPPTLNPAMETTIINAEGKAYGIEFMIKKMSGKVNGWISYTYSRSLLMTNNDYQSETVNNGALYPSNYDKPHAINFIGNYKFSHRFSVSLNTVYSTGRPITVPQGRYYVDGANRLFYGPRNADRIPDYFRIDLSMNIEGNHRVKKLAHSSWTVGIYNLTGRRNAYSVFFQTENGAVKGYKLSILGSPIPTITYNFKF